MCNGLYWVCTHSGNTDDENMNVKEEEYEVKEEMVL